MPLISRTPSLTTVRAVVGGSIAITAFHFADNYFAIETYPQPDWVTGAVVVVSWPLLSAAGVAACLLYAGGRLGQATAFLLAYSYTGISSLGHFLSGSPDEFTTRGLISIFLDGAAGTTVLAVALWSIIALRRGQTMEVAQS